MGKREQQQLSAKRQALSEFLRNREGPVDPETLSRSYGLPQPETYATPSAMARTLSSYIECPHRVRALVCEHFGLSRGISVDTIRRMRERHLRPAPMVSAPTSPWSAQAESDKLAAANDRFVAALQAARRA